MLEVNFNPFPLINTERLLLRQVNQEDLNEIYIIRSDERMMRYLDRAPAASLEDASLFIQKINTLENNNEAITWAITFKNDPKLIGTICYWNIMKEHYRSEIGYALLNDYQGQGIMQEAISEVISFGFDTLGLHSIEANVNPGNFPSIKLLERNNFIREGFFKENYYFNGKFLDSAIYSILKNNMINSDKLS